MTKDSIKFTAFVTPFGQFEFIKMPFRSKVAHKRFQKCINEILKELIESGDVIVFMDDILIATTDIEHHLLILKKIFKIFNDNKIKLQLMKCSFLMTAIEYLGYKVTKDGITLTDSHTSGITDFPVPKDVKGVQSFIDLVSYFRKFIESFSHIAKPLYDLLKMISEFKFGKVELNAFNELKKHLISAPILAIYDPHVETEFHCDASSRGFGAILFQRGSDRKLHPVFYFSQRASNAESY